MTGTCLPAIAALESATTPNTAANATIRTDNLRSPAGRFAGCGEAPQARISTDNQRGMNPTLTDSTLLHSCGRLKSSSDL